MQTQAFCVLVRDKKQRTPHFRKRESVAVVHLVYGVEEVSEVTARYAKDLLKAVVGKIGDKSLALRNIPNNYFNRFF
jgi:hypothetical protein